MKKNILLTIAIISSLTILFTGCSKWLDNEYRAIPESLYPVYELGDTFMYKSIVTEDVDTFVVDEFLVDTFFDGSILYEHTYAVFKEFSADTSVDNFFEVVNEPFRSMFAWDSAAVIFANTTEVLDTTMQGFNYTGLHIATDLRDSVDLTQLRSIYLDWNYGLVKYVYHTRDSYELFYRPE